MTSLEAPSVTYVIKADKLFKILQAFTEFSRKDMIEMFNELKKYEDLSIRDKVSEKVTKKKQKSLPETKLSLFYLPAKSTYRYYKLRIAPSTIPQAGYGVYAEKFIPQGAILQYRGVAKTEKSANMSYSWKIIEYDKNGTDVSNGGAICFRDAFKLKTSNATRFINCAGKDKYNNMEMMQLFDKVFYVTTRDINAGEELFIDYGDEYREYNFGWSGRY